MSLRQTCNEHKGTVGYLSVSHSIHFLCKINVPRLAVSNVTQYIVGIYSGISG